VRSLEVWFLTPLKWRVFLLWLPLLIGLQIVQTFLGLGILYLISLSGISLTSALDRSNLIFIVVVSPVFEEAIFRTLPFMLALWYVILRRNHDATYLPLKTALPVAFWSSLLFGVIHGGYGHILIQGVAGFMYAMIFLKMSRLGKDPRRGYLASTLTHGIWNICAVSYESLL
jgi:membrane protease YdiL (CAAX protease family)